ncbi:hypothetical protein [Chthoniobacter flavus]|uniref:hypothetical protein n=1 Tax=Chthoniobacter flavus TaxID=191863 RepID=UPI0010507A57|nr:hypothetical protein [Chthoniobacter flavus]
MTNIQPTTSRTNKTLPIFNWLGPGVGAPGKGGGRADFLLKMMWAKIANRTTPGIASTPRSAGPAKLKSEAKHIPKSLCANLYFSGNSN